MEIRQSDFDSIRVRRGDVSFYLRYGFTQDGEEHLPESTTLRESYATAFFLNGSIRDTLVAGEDTLTVERTWSFPSGGALGLNFRLDFLSWKPLSHFLPCFTPAAGADHRSFMVLGERLAYPCGVFLYHRDEALLLFTDLPRQPEDQGGVGLTTLRTDEGPLLRLEMRFPPQEYPALVVGPRPEDTAQPVRSDFHSDGDFRRSMKLHVLVRPAAEIHRLGFEAVMQRFEEPLGLPAEARAPAPRGRGRRRAAPAGTQPVPPPSFPLREHLDRPLAACLERCLAAEGGVHGLRVTPAASHLSSTAGVGLALALLKRMPRPEAGPLRYEAAGPLETALRLADFSLKGQHPAGPFFETYDLGAGRWVGLRGQTGLVSLEHSAVIAHRLLLLAGELERLGLPGERYRLAGRIHTDAFLEPRVHLKEIGAVIEPDSLRPLERGLGGLELAHPLAALWRLTGSEVYRKALRALRDRWFGDEPDPLRLPASRDGREADAKGIQILVRAALAIEGARLPVPGLGVYLRLLLPWIYLNRGSRDGAFDPAGGILDSTRRNRLLFQGYEAAWLLWSLSRTEPFQLNYPVPDLVRLLTRFSAQAPLGTSWYLPAPWHPDASRKKRRQAPPPVNAPRLGPPDSRRLAREALFLMQLEEEHPEVLPFVMPPSE